MVTSIEDIDFLAPFKFYRNEPRTVTVSVRYRTEGDELVADCELIGVREIATSDVPQVTVHFTGSVRLGSERAEIDPPPEPDGADGGVETDAIYGIYFHGPTYQVLDRAWASNGVVAGALAADLPDNHQPASAETITGPRLVELCFQTAGVWEIGTTGTMALPMHIDRVTVGAGRPSDDRAATAVVTPREGAFDATVIDGDGTVTVAIEGYRTVQLPGALDGDAIEPLREAMANNG